MILYVLFSILTTGYSTCPSHRVQSCVRHRCNTSLLSHIQVIIAIMIHHFLSDMLGPKWNWTVLLFQKTQSEESKRASVSQRAPSNSGLMLYPKHYLTGLEAPDLCFSLTYVPNLQIYIYLINFIWSIVWIYNVVLVLQALCKWMEYTYLYLYNLF